MKILYYDRTYVSEGTGLNKTTESKECDIVTFIILWKKVLSFKQMSVIDAMIY